MSTRATIIIKDKYSSQYFYRHSDGYPEGVMPSLEKFLNYVKEGKIRNNVNQSCGWLVIIGAEEYKNTQIDRKEKKTWGELTEKEEMEWKNKIPTIPKYWKVGAYEPINGISGDCEYVYTIDLEKETITHRSL